MFLADTLSRAYLPSGAPVVSVFETINRMSYYQFLKPGETPDTEKDEALRFLKAVIQNGWPEDESALPLIASLSFNTPDELFVEDGLIFKGERVVVAKAARIGLLKSIHNSHLGVNGYLITERGSVFSGPRCRVRSRTTCHHVKLAESKMNYFISTNRVKERKPSLVTKQLVDRGNSLQQTYLS